MLFSIEASFVFTRELFARLPPIAPTMKLPIFPSGVFESKGQVFDSAPIVPPENGDIICRTMSALSFFQIASASLLDTAVTLFIALIPGCPAFSAVFSINHLIDDRKLASPCFTLPDLTSPAIVKRFSVLSILRFTSFISARVSPALD